MPLVLALEPDPRQAAALRRVIEQRVRADLVLADSKDAAIAAIARQVPDLILVTALLSPRDEAELTEHLRTLENAAHLQTVTIPLLAAPAAKPKRRKRGLLGALTGQGDDDGGAPDGCDPAVFADEVRSYIERAQELKAEAAAAGTRAPIDAGARVDGPAAASPASSSYWDWDPPATGAAAAPPAQQPPPEAARPAASSSYWDWDGPPAAPAAPTVGDESPAAALDGMPETVFDPLAALVAQPEETPAAPPIDWSGVPADDHRAFATAMNEAAARLARDEEPDAGQEADARAAGDAVHALVALDDPSDHAGTGAEAGDPPRDETARERKSRERAERERAAREEMERELAERERLAHEQAERAARERVEHAERAREETARERRGREKAERELAAREQAAQELAERERAARDEARREREERARIEREHADRERIAREEAARERAERERLAQEAAERERIAREQVEQERTERERQAREEAERERIARERAERELAARERTAREFAERERAAREQAERERLARERLEREKAERERLAREEAERERMARERAERELAAREQAARELAERERAAREQAERELAERERLARELAERERQARELAARERAERERIAAERASREAADRERLVRELAAQAEALTAAVKAAQQVPQVAGAIPTPVRRTVSRPLRRPASKRKAPKRDGRLQDEWGLYDPAAAGFDALYARLEQEETGRVAEPEAPSASDLLMEAPAAPSAASAAPATKSRRKRRKRPAPLAMWVQQDGSQAAPDAARATSEPVVETLMEELNLPGGVAAVSYLRACSIRRVRVKTRRRKGVRGKRKAIIILSRRMLETLRPGTVRRLRLGPGEQSAA